MKMPVAVLLFVLGVAGCVGAPAKPERAAAVYPGVANGLEIARLRCASCHAIDSGDDSPRGRAPSFRQMRTRFNAITWERTMAEIAVGGHDEMPAVRLDATAVHDLRAYIVSIR